MGRAVRAPKTAELVAADLRRQIVHGELSAGDTLPPEARLMEQYAVGRATLREAFRILESERLLTVRRGARGGAQVLEPDPAVAARYVGLLLQHQGTTVRDVHEARMVSEPHCARLLAGRRTAEDLADLRESIAALRRLVEAGPRAVPDPGRWSQATYRFHELVMQRCGNRTLALQGGVLAEIVATHLQLTMAQGLPGAETPAHFRRAIRSYERLVRLVEAGDADAAEAHWRAHLDEAARVLARYDPRPRPVVELFGAAAPGLLPQATVRPPYTAPDP